MPEDKENNLNSKEEDIESLDFDDGKIENVKLNLEIKPKKFTVENLDFNASGDNTPSNSDSSSSTDSMNNDTPSNDKSSSSSNAKNNNSDNSSLDSNNQMNEDMPADAGDTRNTQADTNQDEPGDASNNNSESSSADNKDDKETNKENKPDSNEKKEDDDKKNNTDNKNDENKDKNNRENNEGNQNNKGNEKNDLDNKPNEKQDNKNTEENKKPDNKNKDDKHDSTGGNTRKGSQGNKPDKNSLKDKRNNRPKSPKDFADRAKNGIKNGAKNRFNNSKVGQAVNKAKQAAQKAKKAAKKAKQTIKKVKEAKKVATMIKILLSSKVILITLGLLVVLALLIAVVSFFISGSPLVGGDVNNEENYSKYSEVDQKTIDKLNTIYEKYPNGDAALAMVTAIYPYMEELHNGNVNSLKSNNNPDDYEDSEDEDNSENSDGTSDEDLTSDDDMEDTQDNESDLTADDPYLELLRSWTFRTFKFKKLLKWTTEGEESYNNNLKNKYFKSDKGYKSMFDGVEDEAALADAIISNLYDLKDDFEGYFFEICVTNTSFESAGSVTVDEILYSPIYVDVKMPGCGDLSSCSESYYDTPITLEKYVKGVVYEELGSSDNLEQIKAQMVAAKSYAISRHLNNIGVMDDGSHVIQILWSTRDQDYCDYETGCMDVSENYGYNSPDDSLYKHYANREPASAEKVALYDQAWEETKDYYIIDSNNVTRGSYMDTCEKGTCMAQSELETITDMDYQSILKYFYTDYSFAIIEGNHATALVGSTTELCGEDVSGGIPDSEFKFYYQTDYPDVTFCGLDSVAGCKSEGGENTICTSGCGVTSYAMVIATLSDTEGNFDPIAANDEATASGSCSASGTSNGLFTNIGNNHSGFTVEQLSVTKEGASKVLSVLQNGGVVVANVQKPSPFTEGGHWIVIRGLTSDGGVKVADPNSESITMSKAYDINEFIDKNWLVDEDGTTHSWFAIYGPKSEQYKYAAGEGVATGTLGYPVEGVTGCDASDYPNYSSSGGYHGGTDINSDVGASEGMNILAADGGTVKTVKNLDYSYGSHVIIDHGNGYTTLYAHMQNGSIVVKEGDLIAKGQLIGKLGSTGNSSGPHLHIELRINNSHKNTLNPCNYIGQNKSYVSQ